MRIFRHLISWALALFLIAMFIQFTIAPLPDPPEGSVKLFDAPGQNIVFQTIAERSGVSLFEPAGRFVIAIVELLAERAGWLVVGTMVVRGCRLRCNLLARPPHLAREEVHKGLGG